MSFRNVDSAAAAIEYVQRLDSKWPARRKIMDEIATQVKRLQDTQEARNASRSIRLVELCCGAGNLAAHLLSRLPQLTYLGFDQSEPLLEAAAQRLASYPNASLIRADLNETSWIDLIPEEHAPVDALVSMQSLHDLGGETEVSRIYTTARDLLRPGGLFVNADLIVEPGEELANNPGRLTVDQHLALLREAGYPTTQCILENGGFGCIAAVR